MRRFTGRLTAVGVEVRLGGRPLDPRLDLCLSRRGVEMGVPSNPALGLAVAMCSAVLDRSPGAAVRILRASRIVAETVVARLPWGSWSLTEAEVRAAISEAEVEMSIHARARRGGDAGKARPAAGLDEASRPVWPPADAEVDDDDLLGPELVGPYPRWFLPTYEAMVDLARDQAEWDRPWDPAWYRNWRTRLAHAVGVLVERVGCWCASLFAAPRR